VTGSVVAGGAGDAGVEGWVVTDAVCPEAGVCVAVAADVAGVAATDEVCAEVGACVVAAAVDGADGVLLAVIAAGVCSAAGVLMAMLAAVVVAAATGTVRFCDIDALGTSRLLPLLLAVDSFLLCRLCLLSLVKADRSLFIGDLARFSASLSLRSAILPRIQDIGPFFFSSESERTFSGGEVPVWVDGGDIS